MKRSKRKANAGKAGSRAKQTDQSVQNANQPARRKMSRRDFLGNSAIYSLGIAGLAGGGWYFGNTMMVEAKEADLSKLGNGIPTVVQIHDPSCPTCNALRCEAREAANRFDEGDLQFLIANLTQTDGRALANRHNVGKITLLFFDGKGEKQTSLVGMETADNLEPIFARHVARFGSKKALGS